MGGYHRYVFDAERRTFVGRFEEMYQAEQSEGFDSWHQDDLSNLTKRVCLEILSSYNFPRVLDIGCGKGAFTQRLTRENNQVTGIDVSPTALKTARLRCPTSTFLEADLDAPSSDLRHLVGGGFDLVVCLETLSYLERWTELVAQIAAIGRYALFALDIPVDPIGFVKLHDDLAQVVRRSFRITEDIRLASREQIILFGASQLMDA